MTGHEKMDKVGEELLGVVKRAYGPNIAAGMFDHFEEALKQVIKEAVEAEREACAKIIDEEGEYYQSMASRDSPLIESAAFHRAAVKVAAHLGRKIRARSS